MPLQVGTEAPQFELADADMQMFSLSGQRGKNIVLYFYPKDDTPGCTMEANEFSDHIDEFARHDTIVVGVSRDDCISHASFRDKYGLSVQLLSDTDGRVCKKYGVLYEKEVDGQKKLSIQRSTFIIGKEGELRHVLYGVHAHGHAHEILKLIKEMK
ncbi:putative peroxiredoxin bcp [mine drainage metagenome]|uniref:thioredoxin-dependent peroxiredoxin n=1 Tax=mine drainage metagenome TaxID=410659 RepID=A0A1J5TFL0_9ZZZZ